MRKYAFVKVQTVCEPPRDFLSSSGSQTGSGNQGAFKIEARFGPDVLNPVTPFIAKVVEAQTIRFGVDQLLELGPQKFHTGRIDHTLEHRVLNPLSEILAPFGYFA